MEHRKGAPEDGADRPESSGVEGLVSMGKWGCSTSRGLVSSGLIPQPSDDSTSSIGSYPV
jgi:hypothetical protein